MSVAVEDSLTLSNLEHGLSEIAICLTELTKEFRIYKEPYHRLLNGIFPKLRSGVEVHTAVESINLPVKKGAALGILGANGAGK